MGNRSLKPIVIETEVVNLSTIYNLQFTIHILLSFILASENFEKKGKVEGIEERGLS